MSPVAGIHPLYAGRNPDRAENLEIAAGLPRDRPGERGLYFHRAVLPQCCDRARSRGQADVRTRAVLVRRPAVG